MCMQYDVCVPACVLWGHVMCVCSMMCGAPACVLRGHVMCVCAYAV